MKRNSGRSIIRGLSLAFQRLRRLRQDVRGNTLVIVGAALIPLTAMIGSGVDLSRAYMARERLQQACDAGALAGRRAMSNGVVDNTVRAEALKFFRFNFPIGTNGVAGTAAYDTRGFVPVVNGLANSPTTVVITASTTIPTTVMQMFGYDSLPLSVTCYAKQDFVNTDILLVLDTTGSMLCATSESSCSNSTEKTTSKIKALRSAVLALYDELAPVQAQLQAVGLRLRYGIVPYSSGVNVGAAIRQVNPSYMASDNWQYQSRRAVYDTYNGTWDTNPPNAPVETIQSYGSNISAANCLRYGQNLSFTGSSGLPSATSDGATAPNPTTSYTYAVKDWGGATSFSSSSSGTKACRRTRTAVTTTYTRRYRFTNWVYEPYTYDISGYVGGATTLAKGTGSAGNGSPGGTVTTPGTYSLQELPSAPGATGINTVTSSWAGCIEERQTVSSISSSTTAIPDGAYDLRIDLLPTADKATKWKPFWPDVEFINPSVVNYDYGGEDQKPQWACPTAARRLAAWSRSDLSTYLDSLRADGGTYHDNGMIWGIRFIAPEGIFAADNPTTFNNMPVSRHIIFMTDGLLDTGYQTLYTTYGVERWDGRVTGGSSSESAQESRHRQRFKLMCSAAKNLGISVWVVAFASALDTDLTNCASSANQASTSANSADLNAKFVEIGKNIGSLRLTH